MVAPQNTAPFPASSTQWECACCVLWSAGLGSGWPNSAWDCNTALPCCEPSPRIILIVISPDLSTESGPKRKSCKTAQRLIPSAVVFQRHTVSLDHEQRLNFMAAISPAELPALTKQSLARFSLSVLCLSVARLQLYLCSPCAQAWHQASTLAHLDLFWSHGWEQLGRFSVLFCDSQKRAFKGHSHQTTLPHTSYSLDFAAFVLLPLVLALFFWWENQPILQ